jgi:ATP-dependent DNA helicase RecQ
LLCEVLDLPALEEIYANFLPQFGVTSLREKQKELVELALTGCNSLALLPTGYGKSLCYQLPSQLLEGLTLVISPLIALMSDQVRNLEKRGFKNATYLNSTLTYQELESRIRGIREGRYKLVYIAPERMSSPRFLALLKSLKVSLFVIDEAHCISQWGHDFRPQYRQMKQFLDLCPGAAVMALTATATARVQQDILDLLALKAPTVVQISLDRPNLQFDVLPCENAARKDQELLHLLNKSKEPAIVYVSSRREAEGLAVRLSQNNLKAQAYHAGLAPALRTSTQEAFAQDHLRVIVSTVAFGMGVDKANVRQVIHYNMSSCLENYYQEAGRAGRDGMDAHCTLLFQEKDASIQRWLIEQNYPSEKSVLELIDCLNAKPHFQAVPDLKENLKLGDSALNSALGLLNNGGLLQAGSQGVKLKEVETFKRTSFDMTWLNTRKRREMERLEGIINYATSKKCRRLQLLNYFGQPLSQKCTGCDVCRAKAARVIRNCVLQTVSF